MKIKKPVEVFYFNGFRFFHRSELTLKTKGSRWNRFGVPASAIRDVCFLRPKRSAANFFWNAAVLRRFSPVRLLKANNLSFINKKYLTNGINGFILYAMNANEISLKVSSLLNQIQKISTYLKTFFLAAAVTFGFISLLGYGVSIAGIRPSLSFYLNLSSLGRAVECWFAYKLFSCYAGGDLFSLKAVRCIRWIGIISLLMGIGNIFHAQHVQLHNGWFQITNSSPWIVMIIVYLQMILFHLLHNLVSGFVILFIAWIMDEGRKIQEEQELTV